MEQLRCALQNNENLFWLRDILKNRNIMVWVMAFLVFSFTQLIKTYAIKRFTKDLKNEKVKTAINSSIILLSLGLGCLLEWFYSCYMFNQAFNIHNGIIVGGQSSLVYGVVERVIKLLTKKDVELDNPFENENAEKIVGQTTNAAADGKITQDEAEKIVKTAFNQEIQDFVNSIDAN